MALGYGGIHCGLAFHHVAEIGMARYRCKLLIPACDVAHITGRLAIDHEGPLR